MFNIPTNGSSNPQELWSLLGTFYNNLPDDAKKPFEDFWDSLTQTNESAYYSLHQADLQTYLGDMEGWFESLNLSYDIIFEDLDGEGRQNVTKEFLQVPSGISHTHAGSGSNRYSYVITAENQYGETIASDVYTIYSVGDISINPINLSWDPVAGASAYKVYGRDLYDYKLVKTVGTESYSDSGAALEDSQKTPPKKNSALESYLYKIPDNRAYLHMPNLEQESTKYDSQAGFETWVEGTDYTLVDMNKLRIKAYVNKTSPNKDYTNNLHRDSFMCPSSLSVAPIISQFYFPVFGKENPVDLFGSRKYNSKDPAYGTASEEDKALLYGDHLKFFTWAYSYYLRKAPTMGNLRKLWALVNDYPFAYYGGTVDSISGSEITIDSGDNGTYTYDIGSSASHVFTAGDSVDQFDILCDGITVEDYYSDPTLITNNAPAGEQDEFFIYLSADYSFNPDPDLIDKMKEIAIPAGLKILP